ncbi:MAG TPA: TIR domain-containing protein [Pyrinomonadaceae bacterium]|nr:TIR domain-containing protein [Pyrinomonadaceae bacterium]
MNVFLSYAVAQWDAPIAARLRAVAAAYDISILLPDRTLRPHDRLFGDTQKKIKDSDVIIALMTKTAPLELVNLVNLELQAAAQAQKPIIALVEQGVPLQGIPQNQIVYFDRLNPTAHETSLMNALEQTRKQKQWKESLTALGWIAGIALGLVALSELLEDKK